MTDPATAWLLIALAFLVSLGVIAVACTQLADDLPAPPAEPDLWLDGDDWIEAA